jgi:hypothetical protein
VIQVNALLECQRRLVEGADRNTSHRAKIDSTSDNTLPLPAPAEQTQHAEAGGEERECGGEWNGVQLPSDLTTREHRYPTEESRY